MSACHLSNPTTACDAADVSREWHHLNYTGPGSSSLLPGDIYTCLVCHDKTRDNHGTAVHPKHSFGMTFKKQQLAEETLECWNKS